MRKPVPLFWTLNLAGWAAFGVAMALSRMGIYPLWYMAVNKSILTGLGVLVSLGLRWGYRRLWRRSPSMGQLVVVSAACSYAVSLVWTASFNVAIEGFDSWLTGDAFGFRRPAAVFGGAVYHAFPLLAWSVLYFGIRYYQALQAERERALRAEALAHRAQLQALRYQLNPHFLFNTLNAVSTLVVEGHNAAAGRMIARLSEFLRLTLDAAPAAEVPLVEEVEYVRRYLDIEQIRFGDRLRVSFDVDPEAYGAAVPALLLQPLVENALRHAIAPREEGGTLVVGAQRVGDVLRLRVCDDGPGLPEEPRAGIGLANTRQRLDAAYGAAHTFTLRRADGGGLEVVIDLPYAEAAEEAPRGRPAGPRPGGVPGVPPSSPRAYEGGARASNGSMPPGSPPPQG